MQNLWSRWNSWLFQGFFSGDGALHGGQPALEPWLRGQRGRGAARAQGADSAAGNRQKVWELLPWKKTGLSGIEWILNGYWMGYFSTMGINQRIHGFEWCWFQLILNMNPRAVAMLPLWGNWIAWFGYLKHSAALCDTGQASMLNPPGNEEEQGKIGSCLGATLQILAAWGVRQGGLRSDVLGSLQSHFQGLQCQHRRTCDSV